MDGTFKAVMVEPSSTVQDIVSKYTKGDNQ